MNKNLIMSLCLLIFAFYAFLLLPQEETISLDLKDADLGDILRMFSERYGMNIIAGNEVQGKVTVSFHDVTPEEALKVILNVNGFDYVEEGNIIRVVATPKTVEKEKVIDASFTPQQLVSKVFTLKSIDASSALPHIQKILSEHGSAEIFTNKGLEVSDKILVRDLPQNIKRIESLIGEIDHPLPQVLIEARFVDALVDITKELGLTWEWWKNLSEFDNAYIGVTSTGLGGTPEATDILNVDIHGNPVTNDHYLGVTLQAMEKEGKVNLLSSPRVTTSSGSTANVNVIVEVPYIEVTVEEREEDGGTRTTRKEEVKFKEAGVKLEVTPVVRSDGSIDIKLHPKVTEVVDLFEYQPEEGITTTVPVMHTRETETRVLVRNGETIVIAGLMQNWIRKDIKKIPFLGDIPIVGPLFRHKVKMGQKGDLVIFVTPRIITSKNAPRISRQDMKRTREKQILILEQTLAEGKKYLRLGYLKEAEKKFREALEYAPLERREEIEKLLEKVRREKEPLAPETGEKEKEKGNKGLIFQRKEVKEFLDKRR